MKFRKCFVLLVELMVVINSSYSYVPRQTSHTSRNRIPSYIPRQCDVPVLSHGSARLRQRGRLIRYNCQPTFTLLGDKYSSCVQGQWENPVPMCIKPGCPPVVPPQNGFNVAEKNGAVTMMFCQPGYSVAGSKQTFCDGRAWDRNLGSCRETHTSPAMSCDFEVETICDWEPDPSHDFAWERKNGFTSVNRLQTGPAHDNTVGVALEGHFMLATFASQLPHAVARLISPLYPAEASKDACFRLYYHMYGATTGVLRVYIKPETVSIPDTLDSAKYLFMEKNGSYENAWLESVFDIDKYDQNFQFIIEATATRTTRSNIAIDDVALMSGADCTNEESKSTAVTEEEDGIFDAQSCVNRCQETEPYSRDLTEKILTSSNKTGILLHCDCYDGCVDRKSCCLDYRSVCVFDLSTTDTSSSEPITEIPLSTNATLKTTTSLLTTMSIPTTVSTSTPRSTMTVPITTATQTTTALPTKITVSTEKVIPTTTMLITKTTATTKTMPTKKTIPTTKTMPTTKMIPTTKTTNAVPITWITPTRIPTTLKLTTASTTFATTSKTTTKRITTRKSVTSTTTTKKTTIVPKTTSTTKIVPITSTTKYRTSTESSSESPEDERHPTNLLVMMLLIAIILAVAITAYTFYRKRKSGRSHYNSTSKRYSKRYSKRDGDEVRFLTADEQLDFTMQSDDSSCR